MKQLTMNLIEDLQNPVVELRDFHNLTALIDTGAKIPVWLDEESDIIALGGELKQRNIKVRGLSHNESRGNLYTLKGFRFGEILYVDLDIVVLSDERTQYNLLFSSTMLRNTIYEIDDINHKMNISVPENDYVRRVLAYYD